MKTRYKILILLLVLVGGIVFAGSQFEPVKAAARKVVYNLRFTDGLVGYWSFNGADMSGTTAYDRSGSGNNGTLYNGPIIETGNVGQALTFDGIDDNVDAGTPATFNFGTGSFSVSVWVKTTVDVTGNNRQIVGKNNGNGPSTGSFSLYETDTEGLTFAVWDGTNQAAGTFSSSIADGRWHFLTATFDGTAKTATIFVDAVTGTPGTNASVGNTDNAIRLMIGDWNNPAGTPGSVLAASGFSGAIDEVRIYNRVLTAAEIAYQYARTKPAGSGTVAKSVANSNGLIGHWDFDDCDTCTTVTDRSGNGNTGTMYASAGVAGDLHTALGKIGRAASFDGIANKITAGSFTVPTAMTISAWIKKNASTGQKSFFSNRGGGWIYFGLVGTQVFLYDNSAGGPVSPSGSIKIGEWQHVLVAHDGSTVRFFVNGSLIYTTTQAGSTSTGTVGIGWDPDISTEFWDGLIDDLRVYNRALSESEVKNLYNSTQKSFMNMPQNNLLEDGLVGLWSFNGPDMSGVTAIDRSGNGNNGTLTGGPVVAEGVVGQALSFDGVNDYVDTPAQAFLGLSDAVFTVSAWVKPDVIGGTIFHNRNDSTGWSTGLLGYIGGKLDGFIYSGTGHIVSSTSAVAGQWYHVALTRDASGNAKLYENGAQVGSGSGTYSPSGEAQKFTIGRFVADCCQMDPPGWFDGLIDEARVYNRALSADEILKLYNSGKR